MSRTSGRLPRDRLGSLRHDVLRLSRLLAAVLLSSIAATAQLGLLQVLAATLPGAAVDPRGYLGQVVVSLLSHGVNLW